MDNFIEGFEKKALSIAQLKAPFAAAGSKLKSLGNFAANKVKPAVQLAKAHPKTTAAVAGTGLALGGAGLALKNKNKEAQQ